jgi:tetratricopeptide (TPR) repeat protein
VILLKYIFIIVFFVIVSAPPLLRAQLLRDQRQHALILRGIDQTLQQEYDTAENTFQSFIKEFPMHPAGYLYLAGMLQAKNTDFGDRFNEDRYDSLLNAVVDLAESLIQNPSSRAEGYFYTGSAEAFRSYTRSENGNLPSGIYYGLSAGASMERCLEADPGFFEAKNILGSFYYWRSKMAWIPFIPDRTREGIDMIMKSHAHPYEKHLASHNLMVILTEEKRYAEAERYGLSMLTEYPENRLFLWNMVTLYEKWGRNSHLQTAVERLLASTLKANVINRYTEASCRLKLARFAMERGNNSAAKEELLRVNALQQFVGSTKGNLKKKIGQANDLLKTIERR